jgi:hypothetical protein
MPSQDTNYQQPTNIDCASPAFYHVFQSSVCLFFPSLFLVSNIESKISDSTHSKLSIMASLLFTRSLYSLIVSRDSTPNELVAWNAITRRDSEKQDVLSKVLFLVWVIANIVLFVPVFLIVSNPHKQQHMSRISTTLTDNSTARIYTQ